MKTFTRVFLAFLSIVPFILYFTSKNRLRTPDILPFPLKKSITGRDEGHMETYALKNLILLAKHIKFAKQHVRGTKSGDSLIKAWNVIGDMLAMHQVDIISVTNRSRKNASSVCHEVFKGYKYGYPFYETGFVVENCSYAQKLEKLISILFKFDSSNRVDLFALINSTRAYNKKISIVLNAPNIDKRVLNDLRSTYLNIELVQGTKTDGLVWNNMVSKVRTDYTLFAREVTWFNKDCRLDRLIREMERLGVSTSGGAMRDAKGHWVIGCQQRALRNYTLVYEAGYDESIEECQFCDHIDGPFVIKTKLASNTKFNENIKGEGLFEEFFLRLDKQEHVICPDSLFFSNRSERSYSMSSWKSFAEYLHLKKIKFSGREIIFACPQSIACRPLANGAISPCCHEELSDLLVASMEMCKRVGILCELYSGSVVGAVKFSSVLPWEEDADIIFISNNFSAILKEKHNMKRLGYNLVPKYSLTSSKSNSGRKNNGYFGLHSSHWRLEMWGKSYISSEKEKSLGKPVTKILVNKNWLSIMRNPGLLVRNRFGLETYQHAQHWRKTGRKSSWEPYKTNIFLKCGKPGHQSCLDRYNADGNLQFSDPLP